MMKLATAALALAMTGCTLTPTDVKFVQVDRSSLRSPAIDVFMESPQTDWHKMMELCDGVSTRGCLKTMWVERDGKQELWAQSYYMEGDENARLHERTHAKYGDAHLDRDRPIWTKQGLYEQLGH